MKSFLVKLPQGIHASIKFLSFKKGETMMKFVVDAIEEKIKNEETKHD